jgi:hypothetical protein
MRSSPALGSHRSSRHVIPSEEPRAFSFHREAMERFGVEGSLPDFSIGLKSRLLHKFRLLAFRPRIVGEAVANAVGNRWMIIEQENVEGIRIGISQIHFAENLK